MLVLKMEGGMTIRECSWLLELGKDKEMEFPLKLPQEKLPVDILSLGW